MVKKREDSSTTIQRNSINLPLDPSSPPAMLLPLHGTLPDGKRVIVNIVTDHQVAQIYNMIQDAALTGEGYGVDEFPTEVDFMKEVQNENGKIFQICDGDSQAMIAAFVVLDSKYYRGQGTVADSYIIVKREERRKGVGEFCMQMVIEFACRLNYVGIYCDTFKDNVPMRKIMEQCGFQPVGFLPMSAKMPDGTVKPSVIYYRELSVISHQSQIGERANPNLQQIDTCTDSATSPS